jgi:hypothetical protein
MFRIDGPERLIAPKEYQVRLTKIGGLNRYGDPNFRVVWSDNRYELAGGMWEDPSTKTAVAEYRHQVKYDLPQPKWILERWLPPEFYGTPQSWYWENLCPYSGLSLLGPYPYKGDYESCYTFERLSFSWFDVLVPLILKSQAETTTAMRKSAQMAEQERKEAEEKQWFSDAFDDQAPAFCDAFSVAGQQNRTNPLDRVKLNVTADDLEKQTGFGGGFKQSRD